MLAIFAQKLTEPLVSSDEINITVPKTLRRELTKDWCVSTGVW